MFRKKTVGLLKASLCVCEAASTEQKSISKSSRWHFGSCVAMMMMNELTPAVFFSTCIVLNTFTNYFHNGHSASVSPASGLRRFTLLDNYPFGRWSPEGRNYAINARLKEGGGRCFLWYGVWRLDEWLASFRKWPQWTCSVARSFSNWQREGKKLCWDVGGRGEKEKPSQSVRRKPYCYIIYVILPHWSCTSSEGPILTVAHQIEATVVAVVALCIH